MKKHFALLGITVLTLSLFGCGQKKTVEVKPTETPSSAISAESDETELYIAAKKKTPTFLGAAEIQLIGTAQNKDQATIQNNLQGLKIVDIGKAKSKDVDGKRYVERTIKLKNLTGKRLHDLHLIAVSKSGHTIAGTALSQLKNESSQIINDAKVVRQILPVNPIVQKSKKLKINNKTSGFQLFTKQEAELFKTEAKNAGVYTDDDDILEYGFAHISKKGKINIGKKKNATITIAYAFPLQDDVNTPTEGNFRFYAVEFNKKRVAKSSNETTKNVKKRAKKIKAKRIAVENNTADKIKIAGYKTLNIKNPKYFTTETYQPTPSPTPFPTENPIYVPVPVGTAGGSFYFNVDVEADTYNWTFSDGTTATGSYVEHTFTK